MTTHETPGPVDAILMASGYSRRFGADNKLLVPFRGQPLALHVLRLACGMPQFGRVFFVAADEAVAALAKDLPVQTLRNSAPSLGMRESVRLGVAASSADYYAFFPCDTPLLDEATVAAALQNRAPGKITFPQWQGRPGNPAVFSAAFREELLSLKEGEHAKDIKRRHPGSLVAVQATCAQALADIDTLADLERLGR